MKKAEAEKNKKEFRVAVRLAAVRLAAALRLIALLVEKRYGKHN